MRRIGGAGAYASSMPETIRCPGCGGLNPAAAEWCGQCLRRFVAPPPPESAAPEPAGPELDGADPPRAWVRELASDPDSLIARAGAQLLARPPGSVGPGEAGLDDRPSTSTPAPTALAAPPAAAIGTRRGAFKVTEHGVVWVCPRCESETSIDLQTCEVCGTPFADLARPPEPERSPRDPGTAALYSLFLPGAGHAYLGLWGQAIARAMVSMWVVGVVIIAGIQRGVSGSILIAVAFGIVAFGLWGAAAHDAYREARREPDQVLLKGKMFMYLVLGLLLLLVALMVPAVLQVR